MLLAHNTTVLQYRPANYSDASGVAALHAENWRRAYRGNFRDEYLDGDIQGRGIGTALMREAGTWLSSCFPTAP